MLCVDMIKKMISLIYCYQISIILNSGYRPQVATIYMILQKLSKQANYRTIMVLYGTISAWVWFQPAGFCSPLSLNVQTLTWMEMLYIHNAKI